ncbi:enoyl-CoA hydratase-related protein [Peribacillus butanolivorans]|uniref:enoyl-CoA hydratase-related protein n=1 Tax=Peribacillus butanolivorans TaxID=421767 RepID=UPI003646B295
MNRPEVRNALDAKTLAEISHVLETLENDESIGVIVITGAGEKSFAAGADAVNMIEERMLF